MDGQLTYTVGGTVPRNGYYIERQADRELLSMCRRGDYVYVLTARQMGKSSLMVRTAEHLRKLDVKIGIKPVIVDLQGIGIAREEEWYLGFLLEVKEQLSLKVDVGYWWEKHGSISITQRFTRFFSKVILPNSVGQIVILIDEIDTTLSLKFTDNFFIAIRYFYVERARNPDFKRLSFVLIGVATPGNLIHDAKRTPFNIAQRLELTDFTPDEAMPLAKGLGLSTAETSLVLEKTLEWTGGHPYLTQKIFDVLIKEKHQRWTQDKVERIIKEIFFAGNVFEDSNLQFVQEMLTLRPPNAYRLLIKYKDISEGRKPILNEEFSLIKSHLKLSGIIRENNGDLELRNLIYAKVFDADWIQENLPSQFFRVRGFIPILIRLMPLGGAGFTLASFLFTQTWALALLTLPWMIMAIIWARYSNAVLEGLDKRFGVRGWGDIDTLDKKIDRFGRLLAQSLIRHAPLAGSSWLLIAYILHQEWMQAVSIFPFTVIAAIWAGYSKTFLEKIAERSEERGREHAYALVKSLDRFFRSLAQPEAKYLDCQLKDCIYNDIEGYEQRNVFLLRDVFVPLKLTQAELASGPMGSRKVENDRFKRQLMGQADLGIWDLLRRVRTQSAYARLVILANGGFGKTTLLRHIAYSYCTKCYERFQVPKLVPVLLYLRKWQDVIAQTDAPSLPTLITKNHIPDLPGGDHFSMPTGWAQELLTKGNALVLIDGFDEVAEAQRDRVSRWINTQMRCYPKSVFILTSRPGGYKYYSGKDKFKSTVFVQPFKPEQWKSFIRQWYVCQERARRVNSSENLTTVKAHAARRANQLIQQIEAPERQDLAEMATNPLLLNMITTWHQFHPGGKLPRYRAELYQSICRLQLGSRPEAKQVELLLPINNSQRVLQWLALKMQQRELTKVPGNPLLKFLAEALTGLDETVTAERYLGWVCQVSELLVERNTQEYEFSHRSFQSYLAAAEVEQRRQESWLLDQWNQKQDWWHETILLYVARQDNPNGAIQGLVDRGAVDLAYKCLQETSKRINPTLKASVSAVMSEVQYLRYRDLESYMRQGDWRKADQETYRLMITAVGKDYGDYFTDQELLTFPCQELLLIDKLWLKHSRGKFGFNVQKQVYVECGAKLDGEYPGDEIWERFGDRVGWRRDGSWIGYDDVTFDIRNAPNALLPRITLVSLSFLLGVLFSRIQAC